MVQVSGRLLGLHGRAGAGKTTIANALLNVDAPPARLSFTRPIKAMGAALGLSDAQLSGHLKDTPDHGLGGKTPRAILQRLGEALGPELVVALAMAHADRLLDHGLDVVFDDVRRPEEAAAVWERGGVVIELAGRAQVLDKDVAGSTLERRLDERWIHATIENLDSPPDVAALVRAAWHDTIACVESSRRW